MVSTFPLWGRMLEQEWRSGGINESQKDGKLHLYQTVMGRERESLSVWDNEKYLRLLVPLPLSKGCQDDGHGHLPAHARNPSNSHGRGGRREDSSNLLYRKGARELVFGFY